MCFGGVLNLQANLNLSNYGQKSLFLDFLNLVLGLLKLVQLLFSFVMHSLP